MTMHIRLTSKRSEVSQALATWRPQYPKFGILLDEGAPLLKALRYLGLALWQDGPPGRRGARPPDGRGLGP